MRDTSKTIKLPGELYPAFYEGNIAGTDVIWDYVLDKTQQEINQTINTLEGDINTLEGEVYELLETVYGVENELTGEITGGIVNEIIDINQEINNIRDEISDISQHGTSYNLEKDITTDSYNNLIFANRVGNNGEKSLIYLPKNETYDCLYVSEIYNYEFTISDYDSEITYSVNNISDPSSTKVGVIYYSRENIFLLKVTISFGLHSPTISHYYKKWETIGIFYNNVLYDYSNSNTIFYRLDVENDTEWGDNKPPFYHLVNRNFVKLEGGTSPSTYCFLSQDLFVKLDCIYVVRESYNLRNLNITIPDNSILRFEGGKVRNGTLIGNSSVYLDLTEVASSLNMSVFVGNFANYGDTYPENPYIGQMFFNVELDKPEFWNGERWTSKSSCEIHKGTTLERPNDLTEEDEGYMYYDITLHKPIFWNGNYWTDANGLVAAMKYGNVLERPTNLSYPNDLGYTFFDTVDNVLLYWSQDAYGHDVWKDGSGNDYSIIEFTSILNLTATDFDNGLNLLSKTWVQQSLINPKSIYYLGDNLKIFGACGTESSEIPYNFYSNWSSNSLFRERDVFEDINSNIPNNITNSISTTPYFKNLENSKLYRYNKRTEKLEEIDLERKTSGTIFDRPTDLTNDMIGYEFYDEIDNVTIYYLGKEKGIDIWKSRSGDVYSIIPFDDEYPPISDSNERSRILAESESVISTHLVNTVLFCTSYQIFLGYDSGEIFGNWVPKYDNSKILANKYYNNQPVSFTNIENNINKTAYFFNRSNNNYYRYNPSTHLLTILDENLDFVE